MWSTEMIETPVIHYEVIRTRTAFQNNVESYVEQNTEPVCDVKSVV